VNLLLKELSERRFLKFLPSVSGKATLRVFSSSGSRAIRKLKVPREKHASAKGLSYAAPTLKRKLTVWSWLLFFNTVILISD
jgi:hypothetical protein